MEREKKTQKKKRTGEDGEEEEDGEGETEGEGEEEVGSRPAKCERRHGRKRIIDGGGDSSLCV